MTALVANCAKGYQGLPNEGNEMATMEGLINAFTTLMVTTDPPGLAPIFLALTAGMNAAQRRQTAIRGTLIGFVILTVFAVTGAGILSLLGISLPAFRIAGGFLLFFIAFEMIFEKRQERKEKTTEVAITRDHIHNLAVFPLAIPLISGPGSISATILLAGNFQSPLDRVQLIGVIALVFLTILAALLVADRIDRYLGQTGRAILTRLLGVLLAALAVQFVIDGVRASMTVYAGP
jgi:multiple antibiotic resistance protein